MNRASWRVPVCSGTVFWAAFLCEVMLPIRGSPAAAFADASFTAGPSVRLDYQEAKSSVMNWTVSITPQPAPFKKEPAVAAGKVMRGRLQFGGHNGGSIAFVWLRSAGKLFLDLNRNLDLTDDVEGIFATREPAPAVTQSFVGVRLPFQTPTGVRPVLVDLSFWSYGSRLSCSAALRSYWQGKLILQGVEWQAGIVRDPVSKFSSSQAGHLLLRPWEERNKPFGADAGSLEILPFSPNLFIRDHAYRLDCREGSGGDSAELKLQFTEQKTTLGELRVSGDFVHRILLEGGRYLVVIDNPEGPVRVPAGRYTERKVWLRKDHAEACRKPAAQPDGTPLVIDANKPMTLVAGGPLTNSVSISRRGRNLRLSYQLVGAGGDVYQLLGPDRAKTPEFTVYHGSKLIASGKFEFG